MRMPAYLHNGAHGDIIYSLPVLRAQPGVFVFAKPRQKAFLESLLALQPYIQELSLDAKPWKDNLERGKNETPILDHYIDLRKYRGITKADRSKHLTICHAEAAGVAIDNQTSWLYNVTPNPVAKIVVHRSKHYYGKLDWEALRPFLDDVVSVGHKHEQEYLPFPVRHYRTKTALEVAQVIAGSKLFVGNQSLPFAIAEALKHPRVLEVSTEKPNCMPQGEGGWTELTTGRIEELC